MAKKEATTPAGQPVRILHLSDCHFSRQRDWDREPVVRGLTDAVRAFVDQGLAPDVVAMTGDVAFSGQAEEYADATRWIDEHLLRSISDDFSPDHLLIVPGNHDVDRGSITRAAAALQNDLLAGGDQQLIADVLADPPSELAEGNPDRDTMLRRLREYLKFGRPFQTEEFQQTPWWSKTLTVRGHKIHFAGLCSCWTSSSDKDQSQLLIGRWQLHRLFATAAAADLCVALVHHPWSYLPDFDRREVVPSVRRHCDLVLRGHMHEMQSMLVRTPDNVCLELEAGAAYDRSDYPNGFQLIEIDPGSQHVRVHYRTWKSPAGPWIADRNAYQAAPDGTASFDLATSAANPPPQPPAAPDCDPTGYLQNLYDEVAYIDLRGFRDRTGRANRFEIDELYIPLTTAGSVGEAGDKKSRHLARERIELHEALKNPKLAIIGLPGAGKTTFLKRIAAALCKVWLTGDTTAAEQLGISGRPLPVFIGLAKLHEHISQSRRRSQGPKAADAAAWIVDYLVGQCEDDEQPVSAEFFRQQLQSGDAMLLLDGLDEVSPASKRKAVRGLIEKLAQAYRQCPIVVTSRPAGYTSKSTLAEFAQVRIEPLESPAVETFLQRWSRAMFPDARQQASRHANQLLRAVNAKVEIRRLATNPVMLTALAVVHWNRNRLPEQRAELYECIIEWLSQAREQRPGRLPPEQCVQLLRGLALAMQNEARGRRTQCSKQWAADKIAGQFRRPRPRSAKVDAARRFLDEEEVDSGIIVGQGDDIKFWHLTFQEYLTAREIAGQTEAEQTRTLLGTAKVLAPEWREVMLLLAGVLWRIGPEKVDGMVAAILDQVPDPAAEDALLEHARCAALLGAMVQDIAHLGYEPEDHRYHQVLARMEQIFRRDTAADVPIETAIAAAESFGQAGDPRFTPAAREKNWIAIEGGPFHMGAAKQGKYNQDDEAYDDEAPVREVHLSAYQIAKYPVTVAEFKDFVEDGGYTQEELWSQGHFGEWTTPSNWEEQLQFPNRPVTYVSWFEALAYARWAGVQLPTEAQWERAARGTTGRKFPWGDEKPDERRLNYAMQVGRPTPVGVYPAGATPEGICDLAGNVWEWCQDWFEKYDANELRDPQGPKTGSRRVVRGGGWDGNARFCRCSYRNPIEPTGRVSSVGFRVVVFLGGQDS